jgi:hypothetical protein
MLLLIPFPLFFASTVFGVRGLTAWVVIGIIWCFCSAFTVVIVPAVGESCRSYSDIAGNR